ncbi:MAG: class II aldolase [Sedimentisphaerales bacterium]|nr:class II aldolase [Sedimentisphaerales bacterium]
MDKELLLQQITELSNEFGTSDYVLGGGGNTSVKSEDKLWIKPSGTCLAKMDVDAFITINRKKLSGLYDIKPPDEPFQREALVKDVMRQAVINENNGRASVEAPLHDSFNARFVVHTHPALINGMTCSKDAAQACKQLFPEALWLDYFDPGYKLCMEARRQIKNYLQKNGKEPEVIFLKNHGVFVAADTPERIQQIYNFIFSRLLDEYKKNGIKLELPEDPLPDETQLKKAKEQIHNTWGQEQDCFIEACGKFNYADRPVSPDHIVYSKPYPFIGEPTRIAIGDFKEKHGYLPQVIVFADTVFGVAASQKQATLALELARDGALIKQLAAAWGGIEYMTDRACAFIENWEAELYRSKQLE